MDDFIDDGYTETVGIDPVPSVHGGMEFTYRPFAGPALSDALRLLYTGPTAIERPGARPNAAKEKKRLEKIAEEQSPEGRKKILFAMLMERVSTWSKDRPLSAESLNSLRPALFARFQGIVFGDDIPDYRMVDSVRVEATDDDVENDAKNSTAG